MPDSDSAAPNEKALAEFMTMFQAMAAQMKAMNDNIGRLLEAQGVKPATPVQPAPVTTPAPAPTPVTPVAATPVLDRPGVGLGVLGGLATLMLQAFGVVGPMSGEGATTAGQVLPIVAAGTAALGATGTVGGILSALTTVASMLMQRNTTK